MSRTSSPTTARRLHWESAQSEHGEARGSSEQLSDEVGAMLVNLSGTLKGAHSDNSTLEKVDYFSSSRAASRPRYTYGNSPPKSFDPVLPAPAPSSATVEERNSLLAMLDTHKNEVAELRASKHRLSAELADERSANIRLVASNDAMKKSAALPPKAQATLDDGVLSTAQATVASLQSQCDALKGQVQALTSEGHDLRRTVEDKDAAMARMAKNHKKDTFELEDLRVESGKLAKEARASAMLLQVYRKEFQRFADQVRLLMSAGVGEVARLNALSNELPNIRRSVAGRELSFSKLVTSPQPQRTFYSSLSPSSGAVSRQLLGDASPRAQTFFAIPAGTPRITKSAAGETLTSTDLIRMLQEVDLSDDEGQVSRLVATEEEDVLVRVTRDLLKRTRHSSCQSIIDHHSQHCGSVEAGAMAASRYALVATEAAFTPLFTKVAQLQRRLETLGITSLTMARLCSSKQRTIVELKAQIGSKYAQEAFLAQCSAATEALKRLLKEGAAEIRDRVMETRLLQPQFVATVEKTVARAVRHTEGLLAASASVAGSPSATHYNLFSNSDSDPVSSPHFKSSPRGLHIEALASPGTPLSVAGMGSPMVNQQLNQKTAEALVQQLKNLCTLLQNNYQQQESILERYTSIVGDWEDRIVSKLVNEVQSQAKNASVAGPRARY